MFVPKQRAQGSLLLDSCDTQNQDLSLAAMTTCFCGNGEC